MPKQITSLQNPFIKQLLLLSEKSRERKKQGMFVIEGQREIQLAIQGGFQIAVLVCCEEIIPLEVLQKITKQIKKEFETVFIPKEIYEKIAYRGSTEGIIALVRSKNLALKDVSFEKDNPLILIAEAPEKPGNIGALLRTADAARVDAVIIANPKTDLYNPNIIRSSVGCIFTNQVVTGTSEEIIEFLKERYIQIFCAALQASVAYTLCDYTAASALVVGTEAEGLSPLWLENSTQNIIIPMQGEIDSMNVSVAAGILIFEAKRQRNFQ
jgi:RNA methyltransferase, TrmH family